MHFEIVVICFCSTINFVEFFHLVKLKEYYSSLIMVFLIMDWNEEKELYQNLLQVEYEIYEEIASSGQNLEGAQDPKFVLNKTSGEVKLNFDPLQGMKGHFEFVVIATDPSGHLDAARVKIYLIRYGAKFKPILLFHFCLKLKT